MANVEIYTWTTCPYCYRAKQLLDRKGISYTEYVIDGDAAAREAMVTRGTNGRRSVPQIFINDQHIGGSDDLYRLEKLGKLDELLLRDLLENSVPPLIHPSTHSLSNSGTLFVRNSLRSQSPG